MMRRLARSTSALLGCSATARGVPRALTTDAPVVLDAVALTSPLSPSKFPGDKRAIAEFPRIVPVPGYIFKFGAALPAGVSFAVAEAADMICRAVSTQQEPRVASTLDALGVAMSPRLVVAVVKNIYWRMRHDEEMRCAIEETRPPRVKSTLGPLVVAATPALDALGLAMSPQLVNEVVKKLSNGMAALAFFRWAERQEGFGYTAEGFHHLIEALFNIKQLGLAWAFVGTMRFRGLLSKDTFKIIVRRYLRMQMVREAVKTFEEMSRFGVGEAELSDYNWLLETLCKTNQRKRAQSICKKMNKKTAQSLCTKVPKKVRPVPDVKTYTVLLDGWWDDYKNDLTMVKTVFQEMLDAGIRPDAEAYGALIRALCESGKCDEAIEVLCEMEASDHCTPGPRVYGALISSLCKEKRLDEALKYVQLYLDSGLPMEVSACNAAVLAYCKASKFRDALKMIGEMRESGKTRPNRRTYHTVLFFLIKSQEFEEAYGVFQRMGVDGCEPWLNTYTLMIGAFCSQKRVDMALMVWEQMKEKGVIPSFYTFRILEWGLKSEDRLEEARVCLQWLLDNGVPRDNLLPPRRKKEICFD